MKEITKEQFLRESQSRRKVVKDLIARVESFSKMIPYYPGKDINFNKLESRLPGSLGADVERVSYDDPEKTTFLVYQYPQSYIGYRGCGCTQVNLYVDNNGDLDVDRTLEAFQDTLGHLHKELSDIEFSINNIDRIIERTNRLRKEIEAFHSEIPCTCRPFFEESGTVMVE